MVAVRFVRGGPRWWTYCERHAYRRRDGALVWEPWLVAEVEHL